MGIHDEKMQCILSVDIYNIQTYVLLWEMCVMLYTVKTKVFGTIALCVYYRFCHSVFYGETL